MITTLGGTLARRDRNEWQWSDGTPEPRVQDLSPSQHYNFRCCNRGGKTHVEVLLSAAHREKDVLGWVLDGIATGKYRQNTSGDHTGPLMLTDDGAERIHIDPGEDPLLGNEPIVRKRSIPRVALVPVEEWDLWAALHPYGASWSKDDEQEIFAKAASLGWRSR